MGRMTATLSGSWRWTGFLCATLLLTACGAGEDSGTSGGYGSGQTTQEPDAENTIVISDFAYQVPDTVSPGAEITVANEDDVGHTVTADDDGLFDVAVDPGGTATFTVPDEPGQYGFYCRPHPHMTATVVVE